MNCTNPTKHIKPMEPTNNIDPTKHIKHTAPPLTLYFPSEASPEPREGQTEEACLRKHRNTNLNSSYHDPSQTTDILTLRLTARIQTPTLSITLTTSTLNACASITVRTPLSTWTAGWITVALPQPRQMYGRCLLWLMNTEPMSTECRYTASPKNQKWLARTQYCITTWAIRQPIAA